MTNPGAIVIKFFSSVKLTIFLLILIAVTSVAGTIIPQNWETEDYVSKYGDGFSRVLINLQFTDVYHSYWYTFLLIIFCINLVSCSTRNFIKSLRRSSFEAGKVELGNLPFYRRIHSSEGVEDIEIKVQKALARSFYRLKYAEFASETYYFERGKIGRLGPIITHASIAIILIGGIVVGRLGFKEHERIAVGETVDAPRSHFQIRVDDFKAEFYPEIGTPKEYTSVLTIIENGVIRAKGTVEVNHPMKYKGIKLYQSSYGLTDTIRIELSKKSSDQPVGEVLGTFMVKIGNTFQVPGSQLKIKPVVLLPDFVMDSSGRMGTRSREPRNPALLLELYEGDELKDNIWSFMKFPDFHGSGRSNFSVKLLSVGYYTELQISRDPGISIIWAGSLLMIAGMFLSFYLSYKRIWVRISTEDGRKAIEVGGRSYKDRTGFENEYRRLKTAISKH